MPSPFPGMDPYLEAATHWSELHQELSVSLKHHLNAVLPPRYFARVAQREVHERLSPEELGVVIPDASVCRRAAPAPADAPAPRGAAAITAPVPVALELVVPARQFRTKVVEVGSDRLVTAIELVSPANKRPGKDRRSYLKKRDSYLASDVHFLELDLLRGGKRWSAGHEPAADYRVLLSRVNGRPGASVWPIGLRERLPTVAVPLLGDDPDVALDLQAVFERTYDEACYDRYVRYDLPVPPPALGDEDRAWAERLARGTR